MNTRRCERCGEHLRARHSHRARFCSTRCRVASHRAAKAEAIPAELRTRDRWVRHSATKVPLTTAGKAASSTDPRTWTTYAEARSSSAGVGLGFVLNGDGVACVDLDHAFAPDGSLLPWAKRLVDEAGPTFVEVSPSGQGLHIWGLADVRQGRKLRRGDLAAEIYGTGRFLTVTGRRFRGAPSTLADISALVRRLTA
ncbi:bifunctional DNA primase/polymerase [Streptomyces rochei]|uniref:bifunctional DNA primase/polymerase n=1 Tax=Streptomyces rochei TaxID=1928 RepID=UPI0033B96E72